MISDQEWNIISQKAFPRQALKAPAFLWTRILALIESEEARRASTWWMQWQWMGRLTATVGLIVTIGVLYLIQVDGIPLDAALDGRSNQEQALQLAATNTLTSSDSEGIILGSDS